MSLRTIPKRSRAQRGMSLIGLLAWAIIVGFVGYVAVRVLPTVNEYMTIQRAVERVASEAPPTVGEVRRAFDRQKDIEYAISSISGKDLEVTKENERLVIRFAYDKEIPIVEPVYLLLKYKGSSK
jgi:type II secretory pathway pseudopilin PulG